MKEEKYKFSDYSNIGDFYTKTGMSRNDAFEYFIKELKSQLSGDER